MVLSFEEIGQKIGHDETWVAGLFYGQCHPTESDLQKLCKLLNLSYEALCADFSRGGPPTRGGLFEYPPKDPTLYRFFEMMQIYAVPLKAIIQEKFGDGIISAVNFKMHIEKMMMRSSWKEGWEYHYAMAYEYKKFWTPTALPRNAAPALPTASRFSLVVAVFRRHGPARNTPMALTSGVRTLWFLDTVPVGG
ncbi:Cyanate hydratase [Tieghemiomyces parasiticus]|uniref:Cyanate hydratase n=1 Tax=Tieghemiomyces parasiticus TaxID=78921 RepID=A0A9W8E0Q0_9FUNG|nr:Cyanate hydratase [Tieghemiomyces parasiticus]